MSCKYARLASTCAIAELRLQKDVRAIKNLQSAWRKWVDVQPQVLAWLEEHQPLLSRWLESAASNVSEPFAAAMGLQLISCGEETCEARLPIWWRNFDSSGGVHTGALTVLLDWVVRTYWQHHLHFSAAEFRVTEWDVKVLQPLQSTLRARLHCPVAEREAMAFRLRAHGELDGESLLSVFAENGLLVAEARLLWHCEQSLRIGGGHGASTGN